jgi:hypothetical protein
MLSVSHAASIVLQSLTLCQAWLLSFEALLEMICFILRGLGLPQLPRDGEPPIPQAPICVAVRPTLWSGLLPLCLRPRRMLA